MRTINIKMMAFILTLGMILVAAMPTPIVGKQESKYMSQAFGPENRYDIQVSTILRSLSKDDAYTGLCFQVRNWSAEGVSVSRNQFVLQDKSGTEVKPIDDAEYISKYRLEAERDQKRLRGRYDIGFLTNGSTRHQENSNFYPHKGRTGGAVESVDVRPDFFLQDFLYFPNVASGEYNLVYTAADGLKLVLPVTL